MRILHTADWHIGCRTDGLLRLDEQKQTLKEIEDIANQYKVDMVIIAGDIYDTFLPSAEAEKIVFDSLLRLSNNGNRPVVAIAGNHDDPKRLSNANVFANMHNIYLIGEMDTISYCDLKGKSVVPVASGVGYIEFKYKSERVVVATMPYPSYYRYKQIKKENEQLNDSIKEWFKPALSGFRDDTINIAVSHLLTYAVNCTRDEFANFEVVGGAISFVNRESLLSKAHYTALGHIHQPIAVDKANHIYYSGAIVNKFFDDISVKNSVNIVDLDTKHGVKSVTQVEIHPKQLLSQTVSSMEEAINFLNVSKDKLVRVIFRDMDFVDPQDIKMIKSNYKNVVTISVEPKRISEQVVLTKKDLSTKEIFENFVEAKTGEKPEEELTQLFLQLMGEIVYEA